MKFFAGPGVCVVDLSISGRVNHGLIIKHQRRPSPIFLSSITLIPYTGGLAGWCDAYASRVVVTPCRGGRNTASCDFDGLLTPNRVHALTRAQPMMTNNTQTTAMKTTAVSYRRTVMLLKRNRDCCWTKNKFCLNLNLNQKCYKTEFKWIRDGTLFH